MVPLGVLTSPPPDETRRADEITVGLESGRFEPEAGSSAIPKEAEVV